MEIWILFAAVIMLIMITAMLFFTVHKRFAQFTSDTEKLSELDAKISELQNKISASASAQEIIARQIADELQRSRQETVVNQKAMREELSASLKSMTGELDKMTKQSYEHRINLTETLTNSLNAIRHNNIELNEKQNKILESAILNMQQSNEQKLDQMRETVDEKLTSTLTTRLNSSFKTVSEQLENLYKSLGEMKELSSGVTDNVTSLNRVLTNVKARGTWAEVQLESILDQTIPNMFDKNVATKENSAERVEFAVRIPSGENNEDIIYLPIDSKFPIENYIRLCEAADRADPAGIEQARKALETSVTGQAKEITKYINVPRTTPFAILYLATEGLYAEIASSKSGLPEKLHNDYNIMVAGPSTITALLNSLSMGFKAVAINEKANEVRNLLSATKTQYDKFGTLLDKAKKKVDEAGKALGDAQNRSRIIHKKLKTIDAIDYTSSDKLLGLDENDVFETDDVSEET